MARGGTVSIGKDRVDYAQFGEGSKVLVILPGLSESLVSLKGKALLLSMPYRKYLKDFTIYMFGRRSSIPMSYSIKDMAVYK